MAWLNKSVVLDPALNVIKSNAVNIRICSAQPTNYTEVSSTYPLGTKNFGAGSCFPNAIADSLTNGRKITSAAITDGTVSGAGTQTATHWATDNNSNTLYAAHTLTSQPVTNGNTFTLTTFDIIMPGIGG